MRNPVDSSSSSPLPGWLAALVALGVLLGLEGFARFAYQAPGEMAARALKAAASMRDDALDVTLYGTCLGEQTLDTDRLGEALGTAGRIHNLSSAGTGPLDWYLAQSNIIDPQRLDATMVLYLPGDLIRAPAPWQSQSMELARWADVPDIATWSCLDAACRAEFYLRRGSFFYRYRGYLGNWLWWQLGARAQPTDHREFKPFDGRREKTQDAALHYLGLLVTRSRAAGIPVFFLRMPEQSRAGAQATFDAQNARAEAWLKELGATFLPSPVLGRGAYTDDVHLNGAGRQRFTEAVGEMIAAELKPAAR